MACGNKSWAPGAIGLSLFEKKKQHVMDVDDDLEEGTGDFDVGTENDNVEDNFRSAKSMYNGALQLTLQLALQGERKWRAMSYPTMGLLGVSWVSPHGDTLQSGSWGRYYLG